MVDNLLRTEQGPSYFQSCSIRNFPARFLSQDSCVPNNGTRIVGPVNPESYVATVRLGSECLIARSCVITLDSLGQALGDFGQARRKLPAAPTALKLAA